MPESLDPPYEPALPPSSPWMSAVEALPPWRGPKPSALVAWLGILVALCGILALAQYERANAPVPPPLAGDPLFELQAKVQYTGTFLGAPPGSMLLDEFREMATTPGMAWRVAAVLAALEPRESASRDEIFPMVERFDDEVAALGGDAVALHNSVKIALHDPDQLTQPQRLMLAHHLGWFARVLQSHDAGSQNPHRIAAKREAYRVMWIAAVVLLIAILTLIAGTVLLVYKLITHVNRYGELHIAMHPMYAPAAIYLEAVAIYLSLAFVLPLIAGFVSGAGGSIAWSLVLMTVASVAGVAWPFLRHRVAAEVTSDLGLIRGRGVWREIGAGIVGYTAAAPIFFIGVLMSYALLFLHMSLAKRFGWDQGPVDPVAPHPVVQWIADGPLYVKVGVLILAAGFAPFFEEIMFRGALLSGAARTILLAPGILVMAFIFAAIHPQGWLAVPALMSLAIAFALIRIWRRGSLIASMTAHSVHNGFLVLMMMLLL